MRRSILLLAVLLLLPRSAHAQVLREDLWVANGTIDGLVATDSVVYLAGGFTRLSPPTGQSVAISATTGLVRAPAPRVCGTLPGHITFGQVWCVAADGHGGWFIGGSFGYVQGMARSGLAHVDSVGTLAPWNPGVDDDVYAIAVSGNTVYVGGGFQTVGGQPRNGLAAIDATTGAVSSWNPSPGPGANSYINTVLALGNTIYVGGNFTTIGGASRNYLAALDAATGLANTWNPGANAVVQCLAVRVVVFPTSSTTIFAGGSFTSLGGQARNYIASISASGVDFGSVTTWNPNADGIVTALNVNGPNVIVGGLFGNIGGQPRANLAAINGSGAALAFNPSPDGSVRSMIRTGVTLYAVGEFNNIGGQPREGLASIDLISGAVNAWDPRPNGNPWSVSMSDSTVFIGGGFTGVGGVTRLGLGALDIATGAASPWNPGAQVGRVRTFALAPGKLYVGGTFTSIAGQSRSKLAVLDAASGAVLPWDPGVVGNEVAEILVAPSGAVIIGGFFSTVGIAPRQNAAAIDPVTASALPWAPNPDGYVRGLAASNDTIYLGGEFANIGGQPRNVLASVLESTGLATSWNPIPEPQTISHIVDAVAIAGGRAFAGGTYTYGAQARYLAAFDRVTGAPAPSPIADHRVLSLAASGRTVYAGGDFTQLDGQPRSHVAAFDAETGASAVWDPLVGGRVYGVSYGGGQLFAGGLFFDAGNGPHSEVAGFSQPVIGVETLIASLAPLRAFPNPSRGDVAVAFALARASHAEAAVFDVRGRLVRTLQRGFLPAGTHRLTWDGRDGSSRAAAPGLYFLRVVDSGGARSTRLVRVGD